MQAQRLPALCLLSLFGLGAGCQQWVQLDDGGAGGCDLKGSTADMVIPPPCAAAVGVAGKNLFCQDFSNTSISALTAAGWVFSACAPSSPAGVAWEVSNGNLQLNAPDFTVFKGTCTFTLPSLGNTDFSNYSNFILSVVQKIDIYDGTNTSSPPQLARVMLNAGTEIIMSTTSTQSIVQSMFVATKTIAGINYQPMFQLLAPVAAGGVHGGWKVQSIAINGTK